MKKKKEFYFEKITRKKIQKKISKKKTEGEIISVVALACVRSLILVKPEFGVLIVWLIIQSELIKIYSKVNCMILVR